MILNIKSKLSEYDIVIEGGILSSVGDYISKMLKEKAMSVKKMFIITDETVDSLYSETVKKSLEESGFELAKYVISPGENSKNILTLAGIYSEMSDLGITRSDMIVALGGGVVGDLAGFAASTYLRGIEYIQIPTTLLAQVDSSIGGKTAIDISQGKNLVGSFYNPSLVLIDSFVLETLNTRDLTSGMAEVIKYALIKDKELYNILMSIESRSQLFERLNEIIYRCCSIKKELVEEDPFDKGERMLLNFGHTLGHAIETHYKFRKYLHGEAVAIGMVRISELAAEKGMIDESIVKDIKNILARFGLSNKEEVENKELIKYIKNDKKRFGDKFKIVLVEEIGKGIIVDTGIDFFE